MNSHKQTKRALLTSVMALVMCVVMLVGTTFAWFTDTATTNVNKIEAGKLKLELLDKDGKTLPSDQPLKWVTQDTGDVLWEPNCTYDLEQFQIKNAGNLALKYKVVLKASAIDKKDNGKTLLDVIEWTVKVNDTVVMDNVLFTDLGTENGIAIIDGAKLTAEDGANVARISVTGHMKPDADNDYQGLKIDGFGITVYAAQVNHEYDSKDNSYDTAAPYDPSAPHTPLVVSVGTMAELKAALTAFSAAGAGSNVINLTQSFEIKAGETWTPVHVDGYQGADVITINGNGYTITGLNAPLIGSGFAGNSGVVINDLTLDKVKIDDAASTLGVGAFIGSIDSMPKIELNNCHLTNSTITSTGGARVGGLIGWSAGYDDPNNGPVKTYITIKNCSVENCNITAKGSVGAIIGHAGNNPATYHTIEACTVKGTTLNSTDGGGWRVGVVVGTANVGEVTISNITSENNALAQTGKSAPAGQSDLYGRFVPGTTGKLTIDGAAISKP